MKRELAMIPGFTINGAKRMVNSSIFAGLSLGGAVYNVGDSSW